jgi:hypothetical protein
MNLVLSWPLLKRPTINSRADAREMGGWVKPSHDK